MKLLKFTTVIIIQNVLVESFVNYEPDPVGHAEKWIYGLVTSKDNSVYARHVRHAVEVIEKALERYR